MILAYGEYKKKRKKMAARVYSGFFLRDRLPTYETITFALHRLQEAVSVTSRPITSRQARCNVQLTPE